MPSRKGNPTQTGLVVQLVRIHACHAWGREFESRPDRKKHLFKRCFFFIFVRNNFDLKSNNQESINVNKFISSTGICSRREAERFIVDGKVKINGETAVLGNRVFPGDVVLLDGKPIEPKKDLVYIALNKPKGIVCTTDSKEPKNIVKFIGYPERLFPIGRLDKPSQGLIFLTNDGDIVNKILRAGNAHEKEYNVVVDQPVTPDFIKRMSGGIPILGRMTKKRKVEQIGTYAFKIILVEGLNRQIR